MPSKLVASDVHSQVVAQRNTAQTDPSGSSATALMHGRLRNEAVTLSHVADKSSGRFRAPWQRSFRTIRCSAKRPRTEEEDTHVINYHSGQKRFNRLTQTQHHSNTSYTWPDSVVSTIPENKTKPTASR